MPTIKPRITITLTERQHAVLRSLSKSSGQSMSAFVVEFLELALPTLERMAVTMQAISETRAADIARVRDQLDEAQRVFEPLAMATVAQADLFLGKVHDAALGGLHDPDSPDALTPLTNRGVTPPGEVRSKSSNGAASSGFRSRSPKTEKGDLNPPQKGVPK